MKRAPLLILPILAALCVPLVAFAQTANVPAPPAARQDNVVDDYHGVKVTDPYRWLEAQRSPKTRAWIEKENAYTHALLDGRPGRAKLEERFSQLLKVDSVRVPVERGGRYIYRKRLASQDQYVIYMREGTDGKEQVLIDPNPMSPDHSTNVDIFDLSNDGKLLAFLLRVGGKDETEVRFFDLDARRELPDRLPARVYFEVSILPDRSGCYYSLMTDDGPRVRFHKMGTDVAQDAEIFGKGYTKDKIVIGDVSEDGRYLILEAVYGSAASKVEVWSQDLSTHGAIQPLVTDVDARFSAYPAGNRLYLQTNWNAPKGKVMAVDLTKPERANWKDVVPEGSEAIEGVTFAGQHIFVTYLHNAASQVKIFDADGKPSGELKLPTVGSVGAVSGHWAGKDAMFDFSSYTVPRTIFRYETATGKQTQWAQIHAPVDSSQFETKQVWYKSKDGTSVPMFLVYKKGLKLDGSNPVFLTGYGGFNISMTPAFQPEPIVWAEQGGVYAEPNLRGGGEFGEEWHRAGMFGKKQNVFDDFIGAAEYLITNKYTTPNRLSVMGGSNGGLLVGAALTQRPDLFRAVVCWHPLLDMLRYEKFMEAQFWVSEYGSAQNPDQFGFIRKYSPYQNVNPGTKYPAILFMTGDGDTRVDPLHARKMAALMQSVATSDRPVLLRYELVAGHAGGRSVTQSIGDDVDEFTFLLWQLGLPGF